MEYIYGVSSEKKFFGQASWDAFVAIINIPVKVAWQKDFNSGKCT